MNCSPVNRIKRKQYFLKLVNLLSYPLVQNANLSHFLVFIRYLFSLSVFSRTVHVLYVYSNIWATSTGSLLDWKHVHLFYIHTVLSVSSLFRAKQVCEITSQRVHFWLACRMRSGWSFLHWLWCIYNTILYDCIYLVQIINQKLAMKIDEDQDANSDV